MVNEWLNQASLTSRFEILVDHRVSLENTAVNFEQELHRTISRMKQNVADLFEVNQKQGWPRDKPDPLNEAYETLQEWDHVASIREAVEAAKARMASQSSGIVYLKDRRTGKHVTSRDIGVGMSQLIPVLVLAKAAQSELIAIEQPEIHIHPALQAELGDVFIESALKQGNTFIIETHSEHLILRLLRRIRETTAGELEGRPALTPADIAVLYVEPGEGGAKVTEIPVGTDGDFDRPWPNGFFAERTRELF